MNRKYNNQNKKPKEKIKLITPEKLPEDFVDRAEKIINKMPDNQNLSTTKLRKMLSLVMEIYNKENLSHEDEIENDNVKQLQIVIMRMYYEAGRDKELKKFLEDTKLLSYIKDIGSNREKLIDFTHYLEALVAFFKYYDKGKD